MVGTHPVIMFFFLLLSLSLITESKTSADEPIARHAIAMHGVPKYLENFQHFDYVDPQAPKGGRVVNEAMGTFDSFNSFILKDKNRNKYRVIITPPYTLIETFSKYFKNKKQKK